MVTILDIAREAGVSRTTVSRILNNSPHVDEKTREKVLNVIKELNYKPNSVARNLRKRETKLIAVLIPNISNSFFGKMVQGMEDIAVRSGYNIILCNTQDDCDREMTYIRMLEQKQVDGVILTALRNPIEAVKPYLQYGPIIFASEYLDDNILPAVCIDNIRAAREATEHLIMLGHKRIAFINGPENIIICRDRKTGYLQALKHSEIVVDEDLIYHSDFTIEGGYNCIKNILKLGHRPTAVFAANDEMAVGAIKALKEEGFHIPKDMAIIGFDNVKISTVVEPNLTTIAQPIYDIGMKTVELLLRCLKDGVGDIETRRVILESKLCIRQSSSL